MLPPRRATPGIETLLDNIDEVVVAAELQLNIRISFEKIRQQPVGQQWQHRKRSPKYGSSASKGDRTFDLPPKMDRVSLPRRVTDATCVSTIEAVR